MGSHRGIVLQLRMIIQSVDAAWIRMQFTYVASKPQRAVSVTIVVANPSRPLLRFPRRLEY